MRWIPVFVGPVLYYLLWLLVPVVYRSLALKGRTSRGRIR